MRHPQEPLRDNPASVDSLLREEVVSAREQKWLGEILLARPVSLRVFTLMSLAVTASIVIFLFCVEYTRKERVTGQLMLNKGLVRVYPQASGIVLQRLVEEGQSVSRG